MTSLWSELSVLEAVQAVLHDVAVGTPDTHYGPPFTTAYQLAIKLDQAHPQVRERLGVDTGGEGIGSRTSLTQYLAHELSAGIKRHGDTYPVEGAFLSSEYVASLTFVGPDSIVRTSSVTGSGYDLSMFRIRRQPSGPTP